MIVYLQASGWFPNSAAVGSAVQNSPEKGTQGKYKNIEMQNTKNRDIGKSKNLKMQK